MLKWLDPDPLLMVGLRCFVPSCRGGCPASRGQAGGRAVLIRHSLGKWKRSFCGRKGSAPLVKVQWSRLLSAGTARVRNVPVRPGLTSPTLPGKLAWRHSAGEGTGGGEGGSTFIQMRL